MSVTIDSSKCNGCGECVSSCPVEAITLQADNDNKAVVDADNCVDCGACIDACATGAIAM